MIIRFSQSCADKLNGIRDLVVLISDDVFTIPGHRRPFVSMVQMLWHAKLS